MAVIIVEIIFEFIFGLFLYPFAWIVSTPVIVARALKRPSQFGVTLRNHYREVNQWVSDTLTRGYA